MRRGAAVELARTLRSAFLARVGPGLGALGVRGVCWPGAWTSVHASVSIVRGAQASFHPAGLPSTENALGFQPATRIS